MAFRYAFSMGYNVVDSLLMLQLDLKLQPKYLKPIR